MWIGTEYGGLFRLQPRRLRAWTAGDGLVGRDVWRLSGAPDGSLWISTKGGLSRLHAGVFKTFTTEHGLHDNLINQLLEDDQGRFWLGCNRGIFRVARADLDAVAEERRERVRRVVYGEADGMEAAETNGEQQPAGWKDARGHLVFPTINGVVELDPRTVQDHPVKPPVLIEQIRANGRPVFGDAEPGQAATSDVVTRETPSGALRFAPGSARSLELRYTANRFVAPDLMQFKYRLQNVDRDGIEASDKRRVVSYAKLSPGHYTFQVIACNNHGLWNEVGAAQVMILRPFFHEKIRDRLGLSIDTVQWHIRNIYRKLHVRSRAQAVAKLHRREALPPSARSGDARSLKPPCRLNGVAQAFSLL